MLLKELKGILRSIRGNVQNAIIYDSQTNSDMAEGVIDNLVQEYGDLTVQRIEAENNNLIITV